MPDILHDLPIAAPPSRVFAAISEPTGLDAWWTLAANGAPVEGSEYGLFFGAEYDWRARVTRAVRNSEFAMVMTRASADWIGTTIHFRLDAHGEHTWLRFSHAGWPAISDHFRTSSYCWAMYLRVLKRHLEHGESVPYDRRLEV